LHAAFAAATGAGVLVNTSFNGFHEPIVCTPRDAVRVFYGTGLDMLVLGHFVVQK
jgi:carbamoyltransferase